MKIRSLHTSHRNAFTLVELLVVMAVIGVLATLTVAGLSGASFLAKNYKTKQHMQTVLTAFAKLGQGEGSAAFIIQRDAGLNGVLSWRQSRESAPNEWVIKTVRSFGGGNLSSNTIINIAELNKAAVTSRTEKVSQQLPDLDYWKARNTSDPFAPIGRSMAWLSPETGLSDPIAGGKDDGTTPYLRFPWGKPPPDSLMDTESIRNGTVVPRPDVFLLRHCSPFKTRELLAVAGIISVTSKAEPYLTYMTDGGSQSVRSPDHEWNDGWGRPLVLAFAMYQPPANSPQTNANSNNNAITMPLTNGLDVVMKSSEEAYQNIRTVYLTAAAIGPQFPDIPEERLVSSSDGHWIGSNGILGTIWKLVAVGTPGQEDQPPICSSGKWDPLTSRWGGEWTESSWSNPPWAGIRNDKKTIAGVKYRSFLSAPIEIK